ncbi:MAG TPA: DUF916 domain-containing protein [Candidatus Saccharimonadales bacterium]
MLVKRWFGQAARVGMIMALMMVAAAVLHMPTASAKTANTIKVSPVRTDLQIAPGKSQTIQMTVTNLTNSPITIHPAQNDFVAGDEAGGPALILDENKEAPTHSLKRFMEPLKDVTIPAKQAKNIKVRINVPANAQAGGYFGAIRFAPSNPDEGGQVNLAPSVASLILLTVPGDLVENLEMTDFDVQQDGRSNSLFVTPKDLQASVRFKSLGNVQVGPFGKVSVKQGDRVVYESDFNIRTPRDMVLPDSARRWSVPLKDIGEFGRYTVHATFTYGKENKTIEIEKSFWVIPQYVFIIAIVLAAALIAAIVFGVFYFRKRRARRSRKYGTHHRR